jgi:hypothetical protein
MGRADELAVYRGFSLEPAFGCAPPDVSFARSGDVAIAHQILGAGPSYIVFVRGMTGDILSTRYQPLLPAAPT